MTYRKTGKEKITFADRLASAFMMLLASFITGILLWGFFFYFLAKAGDILPFSFIVYFMVFCTLAAFIAPNAALNGMGWFWNKVEKFIKALKNDGGAI